MRVALVAIQMVFVLAPLRSEDLLAALTGPATAALLRSGAPATRSIASDGAVGLLPGAASQPAMAAVAADLRAIKPTVGVEYLALVAGRAPTSPAEWLRLFNTLHAAGTMQGVTYWSETRGRREILFPRSYAIDSPTGRSRIPDPVAASVPPRSTFYTFQEDHSFGSNVYREEFTFQSDRLDVRIENLTTISLLLVPVIQPHGFVVRVALVPAGKDLLFYGAAVLRSSFPIGDRKSREESLANRLIAMTDWFRSSIGAPGSP